jgi:hypothetical protein
LERGGSSTVGRGRACRPAHDQQHCYHHAPKIQPEAATAVVASGWLIYFNFASSLSFSFFPAVFLISLFHLFCF